jgi:hypothetical protein
MTPLLASQPIMSANDHVAARPIESKDRLIAAHDARVVLNRPGFVGGSPVM